MNFSSEPGVTRPTIALIWDRSLFIVAPSSLIVGRNAAVDVSLRPMMTSPETYSAALGEALTSIDNGEIMLMKTIAIAKKHRDIFTFFNFFLFSFLRAYAFGKGTE